MTATNDQSGVDIPPASSERLYSYDLAPTKKEGRRWGAYNVFTLWANDVHSLGNYAFAIGLFALGLNVWGILAAFVLASALLFLLLTMSGYMGHKAGVPFPVMSRIAFGTRGAQIPAAVRGIVAIAWFGIQTYLASSVLDALLVAIFPGLKGLEDQSVLGLSLLGWITFLALWAVQVLIVSYGMHVIRRYMAIAAPTTLITMLGLAVWMFSRADFSIATSTAQPLTGGAMWLQILQGAALWVVIYGTFVLNFCDFTRSAKSRQSIVLGNLVGIPVNMLFFAGIVVVLSGAQFKINGRVITSPTDIVQTIPNTYLLALASLALIVLTIAVNLLANFVAPIYVLVNLFPKQLNFRRAGVVSAVIGLVILPWNLYDNPVVVNYFLGGLGALLGPLFGVIMADYWLIRRTRVNVPELYTEDVAGEYHYRRGYNPKAVGAFLPAAAIAVVLALVPGFDSVAGFSWFIGAILGAVIYAIIAERKPDAQDVDGESLAVSAE
ncbi:NCS1 family nucleobase:cation symporter-1 [Saccharopolyspora dendranthemae]|uniref:NCS1 family nucleobase:cation symporter-1 n=1 Tax=Saccharopolyspora dendranthemae TaxID=1181886 RepID=A0A561V8I8_9PSEU|nr:NCS1 family nucleobase:cation symporter-1 [Saccharopolyspora dendranthemae]TWG07910.1 NCS1 family nucleobase:cation symporter-1 [Saccharopolyspora dendranthemae]